MVRQRINKVLANYGICSRRKADLLIKEGKILVNGSFASIGMKINLDLDNIKINGQELKNIMLHYCTCTHEAQKQVHYILSKF